MWQAHLSQSGEVSLLDKGLERKAGKWRRQTQIRAKQIIQHYKTQTSLLIHNQLSLQGLNVSVRWSFMASHLLQGLGTNNNSLWWWSAGCWALTLRQAAVTWRTPSRAQMRTVGGSKAECGRPVRLSDCIHTTGSNCSREACRGSGGCLVSQIRCFILDLVAVADWQTQAGEGNRALALKITTGRREQQTCRQTEGQTSLKVIDAGILMSIWTLF